MNGGVCRFSVCVCLCVCGETPVMCFPICLSDCGWLRMCGCRSVLVGCLCPLCVSVRVVTGVSEAGLKTG